MTRRGKSTAASRWLWAAFAAVLLVAFLLLIATLTIPGMWDGGNI